MEWSTFLSAAGGTLAAGIILFIAESIRRHRWRVKESRENLKIKFPNTRRRIDNSIFTSLSHGSTIELMKSALGTPYRYSEWDEPVFLQSRFSAEDAELPEGYDEVRGLKTNSYLYSFANANVKITSQDNLVIDSLTVMPTETGFSFSGLRFHWNEKENDALMFGEATVPQEMAEDCRAEYLTTRWDRCLVLSGYLASPTYDYETYFCFKSPDISEVDLKDPSTFVGATIEGVCLSSEDSKVFYIYTQELR
jgi:hypothetical protein